MLGKAIDQHENICHALAPQIDDQSKMFGKSIANAASHLRATILAHLEKWAALPVFGRFSFVGRAVCKAFDHSGTIVGTPAEEVALVDRMQRVDDDPGARNWQPGYDRATAELAEYFEVVLSGKPSVNNPADKVR